MLVSGNTVYGQSGSGDIGISIQGGQAGQNVVFGNYRGIHAYGSSTVTANRVYNNAEVGIYADYGLSAVLGNTVYGNSVGIQGHLYNGGTIANNLVYANSNQGILVSRNVNSTAITNNTVYQPVGDAIKLQNAANVRLRNNILWVSAGYDLNIDSASQVGFQSDYNDLYATGAGQVAQWQIARPTLSSWQNAGFADQRRG